MIPESFRELLPKRSLVERHDGPLYYLWVYDPHSGSVAVEHNEERHPAHALTHKDMGKHIVHPERLDGFAYPIKGGYRITTSEHRKVEDPYIIKAIIRAIKREHTAAIPHIRYHGLP